MGLWIEIISASILTLKELMDRSHNFLDTIITHFDHPWHGTIFLSLFSLLCLSVHLSPSGALVDLPCSLWPMVWGRQEQVLLPPANFSTPLKRRAGSQGFVYTILNLVSSSAVLVEEDCLAKWSWPGKDDGKETLLSLSLHPFLQQMVTVHPLCSGTLRSAWESSFPRIS